MSEHLFSLSGQTAIVTGASRGLGQVFARALAHAGADLILTSRRRADLSAFAAESEAMGRKAVPLDLDVRDQASIERMAAAAEEACGQIHILVNNAGCNVRKPALDVTWDDWNLILDTNLRGHAGADLILTSRRRADLSAFAAEIEAMGRKALPLDLDVRDQASIERMRSEEHTSELQSPM